MVAVQAIVELAEAEVLDDNIDELIEIAVLAEEMEILDCIEAFAVLVSTPQDLSSGRQFGQ